MIFFRPWFVGSQTNPGLSDRIQLPKRAELPNSKLLFSSIMCGLCDPDSQIWFRVFWGFLGELNPHEWKAGSLCSQWLGEVMDRRLLAEDLREGWELCAYSTELIFIFPLSNCFSQSGQVGWLISAPDRALIKPWSSSSLCFRWPTSKCSCPILAPISCKQQVKFSKELQQDLRNAFRHGPLSFSFITFITIFT